MAFNETLHCPACNFSADEFFSECPKCGVIIKKYHEKQREKTQLATHAEKIRTQENEKKRATEEKVKRGITGGAKGFKVGLLFGLGFFSVGFVICAIPVVGWIVGPLLMLCGVLAPFMISAFGIKGGIDMAGSTVLQGQCPYCTGLINVTFVAGDREKVVGVDCPICRKRFVVKGQSFSPV